jgi:hypothetical protein
MTRAKRSTALRPWAREHEVTCWTYHEECALRAALALVEARIHHETARRDTFRSAMSPRSSLLARMDAIDLARRVLEESHGRSWKAEEAHE